MKLKIVGFISVVIILFIVSCESEQTIEFKRYYSAGAEVYISHCQNCHGVNGEGLSSLIPPLTDSVYLKNNKATLPCFIRSGLKGAITIKGKTFDDAMPANDLSSMEVARVLTYIGNSFGNKLGVVTVDGAEADLSKCQ